MAISGFTCSAKCTHSVSNDNCGNTLTFCTEHLRRSWLQLALNALLLFFSFSKISSFRKEKEKAFLL